MIMVVKCPVTVGASSECDWWHLKNKMSLAFRCKGFPLAWDCTEQRDYDFGSKLAPWLGTVRDFTLEGNRRIQSMPPLHRWESR